MALEIHGTLEIQVMQVTQGQEDWWWWEVNWNGVGCISCTFNSSPLLSRRKCQRVQRVKSEQQEGRFIQRCLSVITITIIVCLVVRRAKPPDPYLSAGQLDMPAKQPLCAGHYQSDALPHTPWPPSARWSVTA